MSEMFEDVFDDEDTSFCIENKQWENLKCQLEKAGYREGLSSAQDANLQEGFNAGYKAVTKAAYNLAKMRGVIIAVLGKFQMENTDKEVQAKISPLESLLERLDAVEQNIKEGFTTQSETPQKEDAVDDTGISSGASKSDPGRDCLCEPDRTDVEKSCQKGSCCQKGSSEQDNSAFPEEKPPMNIHNIFSVYDKIKEDLTDILRRYRLENLLSILDE